MNMITNKSVTPICHINKRESGIELLRIIAALFVIVLHYCNGDLGEALNYVAKGSINEYSLFFFRSLSACAVNVFIVISGYYLCYTNKRTWDKPIYLILQLILFRLLYYIVTSYLLGNAITLRMVLIQFLPKNYFVVLYLALYIISPYVNMAILQLNKIQYVKLLMVVVLLFSIWPLIIDVLSSYFGISDFGLSTIGAWGSQHGYTLVNFILLYIIGAYLRLYVDMDHVPFNKAIIHVIICVLGVFFWSLFEIKIMLLPEANCALAYNNPFVIVMAASLFVIFKKIDISCSWINNLAGAAFTCYLIHGYFIHHIKISFFVQQNIAIMLLHLVFAPTMIYIISWLVYKMFYWFINPLLSYFKKPIISNV